MVNHIALKKTDPNLYQKVLVCGAPERAAMIAGMLPKSSALAKNREYHSYLGYYEAEPILIVSHGVGSAGAAICFQELIDLGAKVILRLGTAGGLYEGTRPGDVVISTGAVRKDGVSQLMVPVGYPAIPDLWLTTSLIERARKKLPGARAGITLTSDLFYPGPLADDLALYAKAGVIGVEMECATLFVCGSLRQVATAGLLVLDGNPLKWEEGNYHPTGNEVKDSIERCAHLALETLAAFKIA